jgi:hypothetical protein
MATKMSAEQKLEWYRKSIRAGGSVRVGARIITKEADLPSLGALASTEEERVVALSDIEARRRALDEEEARLRVRAEAGGTDAVAGAGGAGGSGGTGTGSPKEQQPSAKGGANTKQDKDDLPKDFPGRDVLAKAGYTKLSQVKSLSEEELLGLTLNRETTKKIIEALK